LTETILLPADAKTDALARFNDHGPAHTNCAQTVLHYALLVGGYDLGLARWARFCGGGIAGMGEICGAVSGSALSLGLLEYLKAPNEERGSTSADLDEPGPVEHLQDLIREFAQKFGGLRCRDLAGHDLSTPEGREAFLESEARPLCAGYVSLGLRPTSAPLAGILGPQAQPGPEKTPGPPLAGRPQSSY
jgi:C_GCAxxG_C_C family probable redox protein